MSTAEHLREKVVNILVTNICNLSCGGCSQQCGYIPKEKLWNIPIDQLKWNIDLLIDARKGDPGTIGFFGGEPTLHPQFKDMVELTQSYKKVNFIIYSNGRDPKKIDNKKTNIEWRVDPKDKNSEVGGRGQMFLPTQVASQDLLKIADKRFYWKKAQKDCGMWNHCYCMIYNNKAYFCEIAASWDIMNDENHGWPLKWGVDPFAKTEEEIAAQAENFCYRCGWCLTKEELIKNKIPQQLVRDPTLVTHINMKFKTRIPMKKMKNNVAKIFL
jgi:organic radical activating enzyme